MSFYTALTGLKGAQTDISTTSNNIANVGSNGFKKSRADFGDIFGSTPLQAKSVGVGTLNKSITQQFSQGNISTSANTLDMAISGQGFFAMEPGGNSSQVVYTRNGAFNVDDTGFIVDSNGQFLLGYPVDSDGQVSDKTLEGSNRLKLDGSFGDPKQTSTVTMGVNLSSDGKLIPAGTVFDPDDADTFTATSAVTIFDKSGNPQSATVFYIKTQEPSIADDSYKYDTKLFVDGSEITPKLTRAVDDAKASLFIDRFGNQTTVPQDPAYILEGKGYPLYKLDDLGEAINSTPAKLEGLGIETFLAGGKSIEIVTDPMKFRATMEYQALQGAASPTPGTFWGKDFLIVDVDESGPVSIDIPPGVYNGTELAKVVEVAIRQATGDDKKVKLKPNIDNVINIDLKRTSGDGRSEGLDAGPFKVDLHGASLAATTTEAIDGLDMDTFLVHAQLKITESMNTYIQRKTGTAAQNLAGVDTVAIADLGANNKIFKKLVGTQVDIALNTAALSASKGNDIFSVIHQEGDTTRAGYAASERFVMYSNTDNKPSVKAYDTKTVLIEGAGLTGITAGVPFITVNQVGADTKAFPTVPETVRFSSYGAGGDTMTDFFGTKDIAVTQVVALATTPATYRVFLDFDMGTTTTFPAIAAGDDDTIILAKPSDSIEAYIEGTEGLVDGVDKAFYSGKIAVREIQNSAKRDVAHDSTLNATGKEALAFKAGGAVLQSGLAYSTLGLVGGSLSTNWVDERDPTVKLSYDNKEQRLEFDTTNAALGVGTGIGMNTFTIYSKKLDEGTNGIGIPAFGSNPEISFATDDKSIGNTFINDGADLMVANKRYGTEVEFDTVGYSFSIKSGTTGEALEANSALGVVENQSASNIRVGRYKLTENGTVDPTDEADYISHKIGKGSNQILGFPRQGEIGFSAATGLSSKKAIAVGHEALVDMKEAFTISKLADENKFNVVVDGVSAFVEVPEGNYTGETLALALKGRINQMVHPNTGDPIGGVEIKYDSIENNLTFSSGTTGSTSTMKVEGALRFGLQDIPLGIGETAKVKTPVQATDELGRPLFISPTGEVTARVEDFADNIVEDFYPLFLDDGELTFNQSGELTSPITNVTYEGLPGSSLIVDYSNATQFAQPFSATAVGQDGFAAGRLTNLEIDNSGNVNAGYSNGSNVSLGKIIIANFQNNSGLKQIGNATFSATSASGEAELGEASEDGFGQILSGNLERSNVDITEELVNLITAQRNYQAAAKAMETTTSMTQTIINIRL